MKLATLKEGGRDGTLVVVGRDLARAVRATEVARTLQAALDDWVLAEPALRTIADGLEQGMCPGAFPFDPRACAAPLPRAYQWADGSAYVTHVELVRKARGAEMPPSFWTDPLMYQGGSDSLLGPRDDILAADEAWGSTSRPRSPSSRTTCRWA
jgi:fumarylacetoacetate (FAA) hydrolase